MPGRGEFTVTRRCDRAVVADLTTAGGTVRRRAVPVGAPARDRDGEAVPFVTPDGREVEVELTPDGRRASCTTTGFPGRRTASTASACGCSTSTRPASGRRGRAGMDRSNHYEAAFEAFLRDRGVGFVPVDEARRTLPRRRRREVARLHRGRPGRRPARRGREGPASSPAGRPDSPRKVWQNWSTEEDVDGLDPLGRATSARASAGCWRSSTTSCRRFALPADTPDLFEFRDTAYLMRAVDADDYRAADAAAQPPVGDRSPADGRLPPTGAAVLALPRRGVNHGGTGHERRHRDEADEQPVVRLIIPPSSLCLCASVVHPLVMNRFKLGIVARNHRPAGPAGARRGRQARRPRRPGRRRRRPRPGPAHRHRPARVPQPAAVVQPGTGRPELPAAARAGRGREPAAADRARPQGDAARVRPRPAARWSCRCRRCRTTPATPRALTAAGVAARPRLVRRPGRHACWPWRSGCDPGDKVRDYLDAFDTGSLQVDFDPANFLMQRLRPAGEPHRAGREGGAHPRPRRPHRDRRAAGARRCRSGPATSSGWCTSPRWSRSTTAGILTVDREAGEDRFADVAAGVRFLKRFVSQS